MLVKRIGEATALEVRATGISYVFAPCIAVMDNSHCLFRALVWTLGGKRVFLLSL
jgi:hypothetical protein